VVSPEPDSMKKPPPPEGGRGSLWA
jgi:hypothetical protein